MSKLDVSATQRTTQGLVGLIVLAAVSFIAVKFSVGYFDASYELTANFEGAGQNLDTESDVKIRGVDVGKVSRIEKGEGESADVTFDIDNGFEVPADAVAVIRPISIFGPKYVDLVIDTADVSAQDADGSAEDASILGDGDEIANTESPLELSDVLGNAYDLIEVIDPLELTTIVTNLAEGGRGLAPQMGRILTNGRTVVNELNANHEPFDEVLVHLVQITDTLATRTGPLLDSTAVNLNTVLPTLTEEEEGFNRFLYFGGLVTAEIGEALKTNQPALDVIIPNGAELLDDVHARRFGLIDLILGLQGTATGFDRLTYPDGIPGEGNSENGHAQFSFPLNPCAALGLRQCAGNDTFVPGPGPGNPPPPGGPGMPQPPPPPPGPLDPLEDLLEGLVPPVNDAVDDVTGLVPEVPGVGGGRESDDGAGGGLDGLFGGPR